MRLRRNSEALPKQTLMHEGILFWIGSCGFLGGLCPHKQAPISFGAHPSGKWVRAGGLTDKTKWRQMKYRSEATSLTGFVQQLACNYLVHGYRYFVQGRVRDDKDADAVAAKLIAKYGIGVGEATRWRRKQLGKANAQLLRYKRDFVILATPGRHRFLDVEGKAVRDIQDGKSRILIENYSISRRLGGHDGKWHSHVQIDGEHYKELKAMFLGLALKTNRVTAMFYEFPFEPYAPVRRQLSAIWNAVNRRRQAQGLSEIPKSVLPYRTKSVKVYEPAQTIRCWSQAGGWWHEVRISGRVADAA